MANLPPDLSDCEPIEAWGAEQPRDDSSSSGNSGGGGGGTFEDGEGAGRNASVSSSGEGNPESSGDTGEGTRRKVAAIKAGNTRGKKRASNSGGASGGRKSAVRSKHALKCLSNASEVLGRRATKERDREEKKKARGDASGVEEQLKIARESQAALVKVTQQVAMISSVMEQTSKADQRKERLLELEKMEQLYRAVGQDDKANATVAARLAILESPMAPVVGGGGTGGAGATTSGGVGMMEGIEGGAGGGAQQGDTVDVDLIGCTNGNRSDNAVSDEAASVRAGAGQAARNHARATGGPGSEVASGAAAKYYASLGAAPSGPAADVVEVDNPDGDTDAGGNELGMDVDGGGGVRGDASGGSAGRGVGVGGKGVGGGGRPERPQCNEHHVPCKLTQIKGTPFWECGMDDIDKMCDHFEAADGVTVGGDPGGASDASAGATGAAAKDTRGGSSVGSAGSDFGPGGQGAGAGGGPKPPQCNEHRVPCKLIQVTGDNYWECGLGNLVDMCDHFEPARDVTVDGNSGGAAPAAAGTARAAATGVGGVTSLGSGGGGGGMGGLHGASAAGGAPAAAGTARAAATGVGGVASVGGGGMGGLHGASAAGGVDEDTRSHARNAKAIAMQALAQQFPDGGQVAGAAAAFMQARMNGRSAT
eukprot:g14319.t1